MISKIRCFLAPNIKSIIDSNNVDLLFGLFGSNILYFKIINAQLGNIQKNTEMYRHE